MERNPWLTLDHTNGSTIKKEAKTGTPLERNHTSAKMMKEATGVAFITLRSGRNSASARGKAAVSAARSTPQTTARANPAKIRRMVNPAVTQKELWPHNSQSRRATRTGVTIRISWPTAMAKICHTISQKRMAQPFLQKWGNLFLIVEAVIRERPPN